MAILEAEEEESIGLAHVPKAVRDAGFSLSSIKIEATGVVKKAAAGDLFFHVNQSSFSLRLADMQNAVPPCPFFSYEYIMRKRTREP